MGFKFTKDDLVSRVVTKLDEKKLHEYHPWDIHFATGMDPGKLIEDHYYDLRDMTPLYHDDNLQAIIFSGSRNVDCAYLNVDGIAITTTLTITDFTGAIRINPHECSINLHYISEFIYTEAREFSDEKLRLMENKKVRLRIKTNDIDYVYELNAIAEVKHGRIYFTITECEGYTDEELDNLTRVLGQYVVKVPKQFVVVPKMFLAKYDMFEIEEI